MVIISQPETYSINSAYLPIVISCSSMYPIVFCEVFIDEGRGRTYNKSVRDGYGHFVFDIKDAIQEQLKFEIPPIGYNDLKSNYQHIKSVKAILYEGRIDASGKLEKLPGQISSNEFYVANIILQHEEGKNVLETLNLYKTGEWDDYAFPLTKRPIQNLLCRDDNSFFPIMTDITPKSICITAKTIYGSEISMCKEFEETSNLDVTLHYNGEVYLSGAKMQTIVMFVVVEGGNVSSIYLKCKSGNHVEEQIAFIDDNKIKVLLPFGVYDIEYAGVTGKPIQSYKRITGVGKEHIDLVIKWEGGATSGSGNEIKKTAFSNIRYPVGESTWIHKNKNGEFIHKGIGEMDTDYDFQMEVWKNLVYMEISYRGKIMESNAITYEREDRGGRRNVTNVINTTTT